MFRLKRAFYLGISGPKMAFTVAEIGRMLIKKKHAHEDEFGINLMI